MPPKIKKRVAKKSIVCWNKEGKTICAGKSTFSNYKPRKKKKAVAVVKKPVVKKAVVKKAVVKKTVVKKATKTGFTDSKKNMLDTLPMSIDGTGMITMSYDEAKKAINKVKRGSDWKSQFKAIAAKIKESVKMYP